MTTAPRYVDTIVAIPADTHCGSTRGLMTPEKWEKLDGEYYYPNEMQQIISSQWRSNWKTIAERREGKRLIIIQNGDATEGVHHGMDHLISVDAAEHSLIYLALMKEVFETVGFDKERGDRFYYTDGTRVHDDKSLEIITQVLEAEKTKTASSIHHKLRLDINDVLIDIAHHGAGQGNREWTRGNTVRSVIRSIYFECLDNDQPIPRFWIRSHRHRYLPPERFEGNQGIIEAFMTPCFQAPTNFGAFLASKHSATVDTDIGMLTLEISADGEASAACPRLKLIDDEITMI